jgi:hypothetical protein
VAQSNSGTSGFKWSDEQREQFSAYMKEKYASGELKGRKWTEQDKSDMRQKMTGKPGRKWTDAEKQAMRERMNIGWYGNPEGKKGI